MIGLSGISCSNPSLQENIADCSSGTNRRFSKRVHLGEVDPSCHELDVGVLGVLGGRTGRLDGDALPAGDAPVETLSLKFNLAVNFS